MALALAWRSQPNLGRATKGDEGHKWFTGPQKANGTWPKALPKTVKNL